MKPFLCILALLFLTIAAPTVVSADTITYNAPLNGASEQSPLDMSPGVGFAIVTINTLAQTIEVNVTFSGLTSGNTSTLIHCCTATPGTGNAGVASTTPNFAGFPSGVINIVPGFGETAGAALVAHKGVDKIAFTGETRTGQIIMKGAADSLKRVTLELGGKSPNIVFADADLDAAIDGAMLGLYLNQGQCCCAGSRLFVQEPIYEKMVEKLASRVKNRKLGDPFDPATEQGPQVDKAQFDKIMSYIAKGKAQGAKCVAGGERVGDKGFFIAPTIF